MKKIIVIYFLGLLNLNYSQCRVNFVNIGGDYTLEIVESGEDFEVISHNGIGADFSATIATGRLQKADFQVKIVKYGSINSKCGFNQKNSGNSGSYANPGQWQKNYNMFEGVIEGLKETADKMDRNTEQIKQNYSQKNNNSSNSSAESASSFYSKGKSKLLSNDIYGAIFDFTKAIELKPDYASAYGNRGNAKKLLEDYYGAIQDYTTAIKLSNTYSAAYYNRGNSKASLGDFNGAIADFTKAIELKPDYASAYQSRAFTKQLAEIPYCNDFRKACELGSQQGCELYNNQCR